MSDSKRKESRRKIIIAVIIIAFAFLGSFLIYFILQIGLNTRSPMVVVISSSMEPNIHKGDLLFLRGVEDPADLKNGTIEEKNGDVIVFDARGLWSSAPVEPIVHRIVDKWYNDTLKQWYFITKGDANSLVDGSPHAPVPGVPIPASRIIGVVVGGIPYIGWVKIFLTDSGLLIPILVILSALLIISIIWDFIKESEEKSDESREDKILKESTKFDENDRDTNDIDF
jgi:signal peptidase